MLSVEDIFLEQRDGFYGWRWLRLHGGGTACGGICSKEMNGRE